MRGANHPPELIEQVKHLAEVEGLSASKIAIELNLLSRNAVIGICFRNKLKLGDGARRAAKPYKPRRKRLLQPKTVLPFLPKSAPASPASRPVTFADLNMERACHWPLGEPSSLEFRFCGADREFAGAGHCYCAHHARVAFTTARHREQRRFHAGPFLPGAARAAARASR